MCLYGKKSSKFCPIKAKILPNLTSSIHQGCQRLQKCLTQYFSCWNKPGPKINILIKTYLLFRVFQKLLTVQSTRSTPYFIKWLPVLHKINLTELSEHVTRGNFGLPTDTYHRMEPCGIPPDSQRAKRFYYATLYVRCQMLFVTFKPELCLLLNSKESIISHKHSKWFIMSLHEF